jgi:hypothetical protein
VDKRLVELAEIVKKFGKEASETAKGGLDENKGN